MNLLVFAKDVYGKTRYYPLNDPAKVICNLMKKKTLSKNHLKICDEAGWSVDVQYPEFSI